MFVISPWSRGGWVNSQVFDHTSMGMFLEKRFGIHVDAISPWHRAVCGDLTSAFNFATPNEASFPPLPNLSGFAAVEAEQRSLPSPKPPTVPQALFQEPGTRHSRALPYELHTSARVAASGAVTLLFSNSGQQGAVFHVYDKLHLDRIPRRYTVEAAKSLDDVWETARDDAGNYELSVYGPNGYVRSFSGNALASVSLRFRPEIRVCYEPCTGTLYLKVHNLGPLPGQVVVTANSYRSDGPWVLQVGIDQDAGSLSWDLTASGHWYDFTVVAPGFQRRFAGRLETGQDGLSDPIMAQFVSG